MVFECDVMFQGYSRLASSSPKLSQLIRFLPLTIRTLTTQRKRTQAWLSWQASKWRFTGHLFVMFFVAYVLLFSFQLTSVLPVWGKVYSFSGLGYTFMSLSTGFALIAFAQLASESKVDVEKLVRLDPAASKKKGGAGTAGGVGAAGAVTAAAFNESFDEETAFWRTKRTFRSEDGICGVGPIGRAIVLYTCSLISVFSFAIVNLHLSDKYDLDTEGIGFAILAGVVVVDLVVVALCFLDVLLDQRVTSLVLAIFRFALVSFGSEKWFVGFSLMYFLLASFCCACLVGEALKYLKAKTAEELARNVRLSSSGGDDDDTATNNAATTTTVSYKKILGVCSLLALLTVCFVALLVVVVVYEENDYDGMHVKDFSFLDESSFKQWYFGVAAVSTVPVVLCFMLSLGIRKCVVATAHNSGSGQVAAKRPSMELELPSNFTNRFLYQMYAATEIGILGVGVFLYILTESEIIFAIFLFWPPFAVGTVLLFAQLRDRDYNMFDPADMREPKNCLKSDDQGFDVASVWIKTTTGKPASSSDDDDDDAASAPNPWTNVRSRSSKRPIIYPWPSHLVHTHARTHTHAGFTRSSLFCLHERFGLFIRPAR